MPSKHTEGEYINPDFSPKKAHDVLKRQLEILQGLKGRKYHEAKVVEDNWFNLTKKFIGRAFGSNSLNYSNFRDVRWGGAFLSGEPDNPRRLQQDFERRQQMYEGALRNNLTELELDLPEPGIKGVYEPSEQYEFYRDVRVCLDLAQREIFVVDPYLSTEIFNVYASAIPRTTEFRLLSASIAADVKSVAHLYAGGGNFSLRSSGTIHDRVLFADDRVWLLGQSLKDAAKKKPTYIVEHDHALMRPIYEYLWQDATVIYDSEDFPIR